MSEDEISVADKLRAQMMEALSYDRETGVFHWKVKRGIKGIGIAGTPTYCGYVAICFDHKKYQAHRLAWLFEYGRFPSEEIDHIDGNRSNNRIENLREASRTRNSYNSPARGKSRFKGVYLHSQNGNWIARIKEHRKTFHIGVFQSEEEAARAYDAEARRRQGEFARLNFREDCDAC